MIFDLFSPRPENYDPVADARAILDAAVAAHRPSSVWAMFSGGHDSLVSTYVAAQHPRFTGVVNIATGVGIRETRRFVYETCRRFGWPLRIYRPRAVDRYERFVLRYGFPGPAQHQRMFDRLKGRSLARHIASVKMHRRDRIMLVTGCRLAESRRRMGHVQPVQADGVTVWVAPVLRWENPDKHRYMEQHNLPRNAVTDRLCMSGECLCGAFAQPGELDEIGLWYPRAAEDIERLQGKARAAGVHAVWGTRPPKKRPETDPLQIDVGEACVVPIETGKGIATMCWSCDAKRAA